MPPDPTGYAGPHPDLRMDYYNKLKSMAEYIAGPGREAYFDGADFSTAVIQFASGGLRFSYFAEAWRFPSRGEWGCTSMSGAGWPLDEPHDAREMKVSGGRYVCVGGQVGTWPEVASIQVEHADGSVYTAPVEEDGCAVVFAPVISEPSPADEVVVRYFDASGQLINEDRAWLGAGGPPPPEVLKAWQEQADGTE